MSDFTPAAHQVSHLIRIGRLNEAMERGLRLQRDFPDQAGPAWLILGAVHLAAGRSAEAFDAARVAMVHLPENYQPHRLMGRALVKQGKPQAAIRAFRTAARLAPEEAGVHRDLAKVLLEFDPDQACAEAGEALRLEPDDPESHYVLGLTLHDRDPAGAGREYRATLALDPDHQRAQYYLATLTALAEDDWSGAARGMARVLAGAPDSGAPVFFLDEKVWLVIRWLYLSTFIGLALFALLAAIPLAALLVSFATMAAAPPLLHRGLAPIRDSLPRRGARYLRGFPARNPVEVFALLLLIGSWGVMAFTSIHDLAAPADSARLTGSGVLWGFELFAICVALAWARLPVRAWQIRRLGETRRRQQ